MAKTPSSALGIDLGRHTIKAVRLQRRGANRLTLTHFATRVLAEEPGTAEALAANLKAILCEVGGRGSACGMVVSSSDALVRIIEQPSMPAPVLRDVLRLNGVTLLNQDCKDLVLDCDLIPSGEPGQNAGEAPDNGSTPGNATGPVRYLVGGLPRQRVQFVSEACLRARMLQTTMQLAPVAVLNGFEYSNEETFNGQAFVLVDIGHVSSTVVVGAKRELVLVRSVEFGGQRFFEELTSHCVSSHEQVALHLAQEEAAAVENARMALSELARSITSSIGFFEARREETIPRVFVSGGMAQSPVILKILSDELQLPCEAWDPFAKCEIGLSTARKSALAADLPCLGIAFGAAAEILKGR